MEPEAGWRRESSTQGAEPSSVETRRPELSAGNKPTAWAGARTGATQRTESGSKLYRAGKVATIVASLQKGGREVLSKGDLARVVAFLQSDPAGRTEVEVNRFQGMVRHFHFFETYTENQRRELARIAVYVRFSRGSMLVSQ
jgi:hypothetical protein